MAPCHFAELQQQSRSGRLRHLRRPRPRNLARIIFAAIDAGATIIELGVPFSDPVADGPVIQRASERALKHDTSIEQVLTSPRKFATTRSRSA